MGSNICKQSLNENDLEMIHNVSKKPKEEITFWYEHFIKECPSGKLTKEKFVEFYKLFRKNDKIQNIDELAELCFNAFDKDKNGFYFQIINFYLTTKMTKTVTFIFSTKGTVDFGEFLIAYVATTSSDAKEKLEYSFKVYDRDNNLALDKNEIRLVLKSMFKVLNINEKDVDFEKCLSNIMQTLDSNRDSKISKREFIDGILNDEYLFALLSPFS